MKKLIPIMLLLVAVILALPAGWLNTALVFVNVILGIGYFVVEFKTQKGK
jgi:4-hydroxybenzoate polyprenyltransferase